LKYRILIKSVWTDIMSLNPMNLEKMMTVED
jgi:hypothetical protein